MDQWEVYQKQLTDHMAMDERQLGSMEADIGEIKAVVENLRSNHLSHLADSINKQGIAIERIRTQLWFVMAIGGFLLAQGVYSIVKMIER